MTAIAAIHYEFPETSRTLEELAADGLLTSSATTLASLGFSRVRVATDESAYELALRACSRLLDSAGVDRERIGLLVYGGAAAALAFAPAREVVRATRRMVTAERFAYPATRLQYELGLPHAATLAIDQLACTTLFGALRVARSLCITEETEYALCVSADMYPPLAGREALYNCTADAACALLVARDGARNWTPRQLQRGPLHFETAYV